MLGLSNIFKYKKPTVFYILISSILYLYFAYDVERTDVTNLLVIYAGLFFCAYQIIKTSGFYFRILVLSALLFRVLFLFATPNLSQDFFRFIWDGRLLLEGFNPYLYTPDQLIKTDTLPLAQAKELYEGMGVLSASHFTNYPPLNQLCFAIAALFYGKSIIGSVVVLRSIIVAADIGTLYFGKKLLDRLGLPSNRIFWYLLNPFIIIELTGNLHFEGVMLFFLVWSLYLLNLGKWKWAGVIFACSVSVKLIPILFLPLFFWWFNANEKGCHSENKVQYVRNENSNFIWPLYRIGLLRLLSFYTIVSISTLLLFLPFFSVEFIDNYSKTVGLWFGKFEFNASIYYILRAIGYAQSGYNQIEIISKILPVLALLIILAYSFFRKNDRMVRLTGSMVLVFTFYLFLSTTVHPWYIATLVILCVFSNYYYPIVWSLVIVLSYVAYANSGHTENLWIIALEYSIVVLAMVWDTLRLNAKIKKTYKP